MSNIAFSLLLSLRALFESSLSGAQIEKNMSEKAQFLFILNEESKCTHRL